MALFNETASGSRPLGWPILRFQDRVRNDLRHCGILVNWVERACAERNGWLKPVHKGEQVTKRTTRSGQKLNVPLFKTASGQRTFYYRTVGLWNNLDPLFKPSRSVQVFKRTLKNKLLDNFVNTS